jgi:hypothetical protein
VTSSADTGSHQRWIAELALVSERYPLLARNDQLVKALMEADVVFAMFALATGGHDNPYSHGARQGSGPAEKCIRARARDPRQRPALAAFFGVGEAELQARMSAFYGSLRPGKRCGPTNSLCSRSSE